MGSFTATAMPSVARIFRALVEGLDLERRLVGRNLKKDIALLDDIALGDNPLADGRLVHRLAEHRH
jgi:hypothetical protein